MFLRFKDYERSIQLTQLTQLLTAGGDSVRISNEFGTLEEVKSYLRQKYDTSKEFLDTVVFSPTTTYNANQLIELNASAYVPTTSYLAANKTLVLYSGNVYMCITNTTGAFDVSKWKLLGAQYDLFYVTPPSELFNINKAYNINDVVFWENKVYQALKPTPQIDQSIAIQYFQYSNIPLPNVLPNDVNNGAAFWGNGVTFTLTTLLPSNVVGDFSAWDSGTSYLTGNIVSYGGALYQAQAGSVDVTPGTSIFKWAVLSWTSGDNRNQKMVELFVDVCIYKINKQIAPRNITQAIIDAYNVAIEWLDMARKGLVQTDLPIIQPLQGNRIRYGGNVKQQNSY